MDLEMYGVSAVLIIIGLVQLAKSAGLPSKWAGLVAVTLGVVASVCFTLWGEVPVYKAVIVGLALGLSAAGLWSTQKATRGL